MSYTCPLGRIQKPRRSGEYTGDIIPEKIRLADGREFAVIDLIGRVRDRKNYNLRKKSRPVSTAGSEKYSIEERIWLCDATVEQTMERYAITASAAYTLINTYRRQLNYRARQRHKIVYSDE
jgi:hypothetical protein